jgi:hypothetical protein
MSHWWAVDAAVLVTAAAVAERVRRPLVAEIGRLEARLHGLERLGAGAAELRSRLCEQRP